MFAKSATLPQFFALIKIHKHNNPIRPIVSFIDSPTYFAAQFLNKIMSPLTDESPHKLKNSTEAKDKLKDMIISESHTLVSFDVKALFTSIPQDLALKCVEKVLNNNKDLHFSTSLSVSNIMKLIGLCLKSTYFSSNSVIYRQIKGTPMGSPISVVIAEIVLLHIEDIAIPNIHDSIYFWYHYVDDVFTCIKNDDINNTLDCINSIDSNIQFTVEREENSTISFLDLKICRNVDGTLCFSIFRKPTHTDV